MALLPYLPVAVRLDVVREVLAIVQAIDDQYERREKLLAFAERLPDDLRPQIADAVLALARTLSPIDGALVLLAFAKGFQAGQAAALFAAAQEHAHDVLAGDDPSARLDLLLMLANALPAAERDPVYERALADLAALAKMYPDSIDPMGLRESLPNLSPALAAQMLAIVRTIPEWPSCGFYLARLAPMVSPQTVAEVAALLRTTAVHGAPNGIYLANLAAGLPSDDERIALLEEALAYGTPLDQAICLQTALQLFPEHQRPALAERALGTTRLIDDHEERGPRLVFLLPYLQAAQRPAVIQEAIASVVVISDARDRSQALIALASRIAEQQSDHVLDDILALVRTIREPDERAGLLSQIVPVIAAAKRPALCEQVLDRVWETMQENRTWWLANILPYLPEKQQSTTIKRLLEEVKDYDWLSCAYILKPLISEIPQRTRQQLLKRTLEDLSKPKLEREQMPEDLLAWMNTDQIDPVLDQIVELIVQRAASGEDWYDLLSAVAQHLEGARTDRMLALVAALDSPKQRAALLADLVPGVAEGQQAKVVADMLEAAVQSQDIVLLAQALIAASVVSSAPPGLAEARRQLIEALILLQREPRARLLNTLAEADLVAALGLPADVNLVLVRQILEAGDWRWL
jgi:hypothetical protein